MLYKRVCIKIGSNVLADKKGGLNHKKIEHLAEQISLLKKQGLEIILISSGAVAAGRQILPKPKINDTVALRQIWASIGQVKLMNHYSEIFQKLDILCSQVLVTKSDFRDREHYLNMKNCILALLCTDILPIINENDVVSVTELMFTDNDELAGLIASMIDAEALIILSNVDGIYKNNKSGANVEIIREIENGINEIEEYISANRSEFGRGGMITKSKIARKVASQGIAVYITNGLKENILFDLLNDESKVLFTKFLPGKKRSTIKKWIAHTEGFEKGVVYINEGARKALYSNKATSLLFVGIIKIEGNFEKGDIVKIISENGQTVGFGKVKFNSETAKSNIGKENIKPLIHYDYLYLKDDF